MPATGLDVGSTAWFCTFLNSFFSMGYFLSEEQLALALHKLDTNNDGVISFEEFQQASDRITGNVTNHYFEIVFIILGCLLLSFFLVVEVSREDQEVRSHRRREGHHGFVYSVLPFLRQGLAKESIFENFFHSSISKDLFLSVTFTG